MPVPKTAPIGLQVTRTAKVLSRAFDDALAAGDGSLPAWLVLVSLVSGTHGKQRELADAVGIEGATLTHHLNRMESAGLVVRRRDPDNRRVQQVELTAAGQATFHSLRQHVAAFDKQLRVGFTEEELTQLRGFLDRLRANVAKGGSR